MLKFFVESLSNRPVAVNPELVQRVAENQADPMASLIYFSKDHYVSVDGAFVDVVSKLTSD